MLLHLVGEAQDVKGLISELHVLLVVNGGNSQLPLGHVPVVLDVVGQQALLLQVRNLVGHTSDKAEELSFVIIAQNVSVQHLLSWT